MKIGPKYKICRRLGSGVFEKCQTQKYTLSEARGGRRRGRRRPRSNFALQLLEKQKARFTYGMTERQFRNYVRESLKSRGPTEELYTRLENRLDNVVYRLGIAKTRQMARQMVSHGHITVNGRKVTIPSYQVNENDIVAVRENSKDKTLFQMVKEENGSNPPVWLSYNPQDLTGTVKGRPQYRPSDELFDLSRVLEYYSR